MSDPTSESSANYVLLTRLADEFAARYRAGERPALQEYLERYPQLADEMPLMKVVQKEGDRFPELAAKVNARIIARGHQQGIAIVGRLLGDVLSEHEVSALVSVALGALVGYRVEEAMFGPRPVSEDDFLETWVDMLMSFAERRGVVPAAETSEVG